MDSFFDFVRARLLSLPRPERLDVAEKAGVGKPTVDKICYGVTHNSRVRTLEAIAAELDKRDVKVS